MRKKHFLAKIEEMERRAKGLGNFEMLVLLAVIRLGDGAYGVPIADEIENATGRQPAVGSIYAALERLEYKGLVSSSLGEATAERGGKAKKYFQATPKGLREIRASRQALLKLWKGLPQLTGGKA